ncbi:hypothetical protein [Rouxiella badensis]|uniref:hypothetical protein n=1 Tax=Rouxiella badensis TaxID=1646377 RepID=UPI001788129E|nr:hypothetical protein [Rouxiella badensis]QOI58062.1 hypothetical protein H2866_23165 [Rouxiella badensis subsp. acadiensis]
MHGIAVPQGMAGNGTEKRTPARAASSTAALIQFAAVWRDDTGQSWVCFSPR